MRFFLLVSILAILFSGCDENRIYEKNHDFPRRQWLVTDSAAFEFAIPDGSLNYNLYCDVRNTVSFPYSRLFFSYCLEDSTGRVLQKKLTQVMLFDPRTGKPYGKSGLGDIYDNRVPVLNNYAFPYTGKYKMSFKQDTRMDTLQGILAVGLRVEKTEPVAKD